MPFKERADCSADVFFSMNPRSDFLVFGQPAIEQAEIDEVTDSLRRGWLGTGPKVARFEQQFADYKGVRSAVAVNSCTAALHLSLLAAGLSPGDEVITSALTFCATVNAIIHAGATPVLADVDPATMNISTDDVRRRITPRTRALVVVHFAGMPCEMDALLALAERHQLRLIEDCAHAIETEHDGRKAGTFGQFGCFSFYATKNVCTGEGGMILARDEADIRRLKMLALHGMSHDAWRRYSDAGFKHYEIVECGFKYNMMDLQAALGIHQLARIERCWERRREIFWRYRADLAALPIVVPQDAAPAHRHAYHLFPILIDPEQAGLARDAFLDQMTAHNIGVGVHYRSIAEHPFYRERFHWNAHDYPNAFRIGRHTVSLPLSPRLADRDVDDVVQAVHRILRGRRAGA
jgi:dTDP-4-amino-4,6-dideoxygalactose transaminase